VPKHTPHSPAFFAAGLSPARDRRVFHFLLIASFFRGTPLPSPGRFFARAAPGTICAQVPKPLHPHKLLM
jgi:hypothetical protein